MKTLLLTAAVCAAILSGCGSPSAETTTQGTSTGSASGTSTPAKTISVSSVILSDKEGGQESVATFSPDTPKLYAHVNLDNAHAGDKVKGAWIATKTNGAPEETKIDEIEVNLTDQMNVANISLSHPTKGWPLGDYRLEISLNGALAETVKFKVVQ